jgi:hypothetical protein
VLHGVRDGVGGSYSAVEVAQRLILGSAVSGMPVGRFGVDVNTVTATSGVVTAVACLGVSAYVAGATRKHNRLSVQPLLELTTTFLSCVLGTDAVLGE